MKKIILVSLLAVSLCWGAEAQILKVGLHAGANTGSLNFTPAVLDGVSVSPLRSGVGYQFGVAVRLSIPGFIHIQPELNVSSRDYMLGLTPTTSTALSKVRITSKNLELPVALGFKIGPVRIFAGPVFVLNNSQSSSPKERQVVMRYDKSKVAMMIGAGLESKKVFFDVRYSTFLDDFKASFAYNGAKVSTTVKADELWQFGAGFFF